MTTVHVLRGSGSTGNPALPSFSPSPPPSDADRALTEHTAHPLLDPLIRSAAIYGGSQGLRYWDERARGCVGLLETAINAHSGICVQRTSACKPDRPGFQASLCHFLTERPWAPHRTPPCLSFPLCNTVHRTVWFWRLCEKRYMWFLQKVGLPLVQSLH